MTQFPIALTLALAFAASVQLSGCDRLSNLTEQEYIQRAKDFEDNGNLRGSIVELKNAIQKNPDSPQARLLLGQVYLKVGMGAEAEKELGKAENLGVKRESIQAQLGEALLLMGEYQRVLDEIQPGDQTSKTHLARIYQLRADALFRLGKPAEACALFQKSLDADASNPPTYWGLSQCAIAGRDMAKAREWLETALKLKDRHASTWVLIGDWEQLNKNQPGALAAYTTALKSEPYNLEALQNRAVLSIAMDQLDVASKDIAHIRKLAPRSILVNFLQALYSFQQKKFPEARDALQAVFKITTDHMPSVLLAGTTAYALGTYQQAETHLHRYLTRYPGHAFARRMMAATQIKLNKADRALETLDPLLALDATDTQALVLASDAYRSKNEHAKAAALLEKAALIDPRNASIQTQLGVAHLTTGNTLLAIAKLRNAAAMNEGLYKADSLLAQTYLNRKEYDKALAAIDAMEKKLPGSAVTHTMRGSAYLGKRDLDRARASFEQALKVDPVYFPAAASLAQLDLRDQKPDAARKRFERILQKQQNDLQAMMALAGLAASQNQEKDYVEWLEKAAKAHPQAVPPQAALVRFHLTRKDAKTALVVANQTINANPDNPAALTLLGNTQLAVGDRASAIATFNRLVQKTDQSPDALLQLAQAQIADKQLANARTTLQKALKFQADHLPSQETLIRLEVTDNKPDAALKIARTMQAQQPTLALGYDREGDLHLAQNQIPPAIKSYQQALEKGAGSAGLIKLFRAQLLDNAAAAEQRLHDWIRQNPDDNVVRAYAAEYYMRNGRNKEAIAQYQEVDRRAPNTVLLLNNLANLYQREKDSRALATAERALKLAPDNPVVQDTLGWILVEQGQAPRGLEWLKKAAAGAPDNAAIRYHHAVALAQSGNKTQARKELEKLLADTPKFSDADAARALLKRL
jgi:putative PEP-CTERM system TPR-repeat lipoprotein